jgi:hypothetical protein
MIAASSRVHILKFEDGRRWYLNKVENVHNPQTGRLILRGIWDSDPSWSRPFTYETATIIRGRFKDEQRLATRITLTAGEFAELIEE